MDKEALEEYKRIRKEVSGEEISDAQALEEATNLINLFRAIYRPIQKKDKKQKPSTEVGVLQRTD